jgi:hypothetical protein
VRRGLSFRGRCCGCDENGEYDDEYVSGTPKHRDRLDIVSVDSVVQYCYKCYLVRMKVDV